MITTKQLIDTGPHHFSPLERAAIKKLMKQYAKETLDEIFNAPWKYINPDGSLDLQHIIKIKENLK